MTDTYEGWSNRETWCTNLWLANDEGTYEMVREWAMQALDAVEDDDSTQDFTYFASVKDEAIYNLAEQLKDWFEELAADIIDGPDDERIHTSHQARAMVMDIGSLYRVDWREIAEGWVTDAMEELTRGGGR